MLAMRRWMLLGLALLLAASRVQAERLVVFGDDSYAPVIHLVQGQPAGVLAELLRQAEHYSGDSYELQLMPWKRAYEMARRQQGGLIGVSTTAERREQCDFSRPIYSDDIHVAVLKGHEFPLHGLDDLRGKLIGGVLGASYGEAMDQAIRDGLFQVDRDISQASRLRKLLAGRLDGALIGNGQRGFELALASHPSLRGQESRFVLLPTPLVHDPLLLAFPKGMNKADAIARFDTAMAKVVQLAAARR